MLGLSVNNLDQSKRFTELNLGLVATLAGPNHDGIAETETVNVALYPNPTHESVTILADDNISHINLYNQLGQLIKKLELKGRNQCTIDTSGLASGVYVVKINTENGIVAKRLIIH